MAVNWFSGGLLTEHGYQPRHRSARRARNDVGGLDHPWLGNSAEPGSTAARPDAFHEELELSVDDVAYDAPDQMTPSEIRRVLEGCAIDDPATVVPELVQLIAHSSHTPATLARAWSEFEEATRDVYALRLRMRVWSAFIKPDETDDAVALMLSYADDAWRLITRGPSYASAAASVAR
jgi:hypothetical protein